VWTYDSGAQIMPSSVPVIDLAPWFGGDEAARGLEPWVVA
jgi:hypothetical protein